jgi:hypothetical protein
MTTSPIRKDNDLPDRKIAPQADKIGTARHPVGQISDVFNLLKDEQGPSLSIEQLNELTAASWAGEL